MLIKRITLLFFRDKENVFFSLLAVFIILGLYVLFMGSMMEQALRAEIGFDSDLIGVTMSSLILGGMIAVTGVTSCMGALGISVEDKERAAKDFLTSPAKRSRLTAGYVLGSACVGLIMSLFAAVICLVYIAAQGGGVPDLAGFALLLFTVVLSVLCGNSMIYFISVFISTQNAFSAASTLLGTLIGFLMGIYIPVGNMPNAVQWIIKCFPMSHAASMFRQLLADDGLAELFEHAPPEALQGFREFFGVTFVFGGYKSGFWFSAGVLAVSIVVFYGLSLVLVRVRRRK
jgi:multidrug/hemolysin transport system permease protein